MAFLDTLGTPEESLDLEEEPYFPAKDNVGFFETWGKSLVGGFLTVGKGLVGTTEELVEFLPWVGEENYLTKVGANIEEARKQFEVTPDSAMEWGAKILGQALPYMGSALVGGLYAGAGGAAAVAFAVEGQDAYDSAKARGATETEANLERGIVGTINAAIEALQITRLMKFSKAGKGSFKVFKEAVKNKAFEKVLAEGGKFTGKLLMNSVEEALEESLQEGVSISAPALIEGKEALPLREDGTIDTGAILKRVGEAALAGAVISPFLGTARAFIPAMAAPTTQDWQTIKNNIQNTEGKSEEWKTARIWEIDNQIEQITVTRPEQVGPKTFFETQLDNLRGMIHNATEKYTDETFREYHEDTISKRRGARKQDVKKFKEENAHRVITADNPGGDMSANEYAATIAILEQGPLKPEFNIEVTNEVDDAMRQAIFDSIDPVTFQWNEAQAGWNKLSKELVLPEISEIKAMSEFLPKDITDALMGLAEKSRKARRGLTGKIVDALYEMTNLPRALVASMDMSFVGIQGLKLSIRHPVLGMKAMASGWRAFLNEENLVYQRKKHETNPKFQFAKDVMGVAYYEVGTQNTSEFFLSQLAKKIPGIKAAERGYNAAANELRMGVAFQLIEKLGHEGLTTGQWKDLGSAINHLSGHGDLKSLKKLMPLMNFAMFSAKKNLANAQLAQDLNPWKLVKNGGKPTPAMKMVAGTLVADTVFAMGVLYLLSLIKGVEVECDPKSTDFGKIRIGDTRFEFFGDSHRICRVVAQLITGKHKTRDGELIDAEKISVISRYLQSKASPVAGLTIDLIRGEDYLGRPLTGSTEDIVTQVFERTTPLFIQDMYDYIRYNNLDMDIVYAAPLAFHGVTTLTYPESKSGQARSYKNAKAKEYYGTKWEELGPEAQKYLRLFEPNIEELELMAKQEKNDKAVNTRFLKEQRKSERKLFNSLPMYMQDELNKLLVDVGGLSRIIADGWYLNDQRWLEYQSRVAQEVKETLPLYLDLDIDPLMKRMLIESSIANIKDLIRRELVFKATIEDLERM